MSEQIILKSDNNYIELDDYLKSANIQKPMLVCGQSIELLTIGRHMRELDNIVRFMDFEPNPSYDSVVKGVEVFNINNCDGIIAIGGGSAMDVAKCIKLFANLDSSRDYIEQEPVPNDIPLIAMPTTAGSGSESTRYAVIYYRGEKYSVTDSGCIPTAVILDSSVLKTLSEYQRKSTMLDALCHAIESYWSVNSNDLSKDYSRRAIRMVLDNLDAYLQNDDTANENMIIASNLAGKAINITATTAGHAMSYKITGLYNVAHGHAVAMCVAEIWHYMLENINDCTDVRGCEYLSETFTELAKIFGFDSQVAAADKFTEIYKGLNLPCPSVRGEEWDILAGSVNERRLKNNPVKLSYDTLNMLYHRILCQ